MLWLMNHAYLILCLAFYVRLNLEYDVLTITGKWKVAWKICVNMVMAVDVSTLALL